MHIPTQRQAFGLHGRSAVTKIPESISSGVRILEILVPGGLQDLDEMIDGSWPRTDDFTVDSAVLVPFDGSVRSLSNTNHAICHDGEGIEKVHLPTCTRPSPCHAFHDIVFPLFKLGSRLLSDRSRSDVLGLELAHKRQSEVDLLFHAGYQRAVADRGIRTQSHFWRAIKCQHRYFNTVTWGL